MGIREWSLVAKVLKKGYDVGTGKISKEQATQEATDMMLGAAGVLPPVPLKNMLSTAESLRQKIATMQSSPTMGDVTQLRTYLMSYYGHLMQGGDPLPDSVEVAVIKATSEYVELVQGYPALQEALAAIEMQREQCVFGYQMADGTIYAPDITWTPEQWVEMREQAVDQTARCWKQHTT